MISSSRDFRRCAEILFSQSLSPPVEQSRVSRACIARDFLKDDESRGRGLEGEAGVFLSLLSETQAAPKGGDTLLCSIKPRDCRESLLSFFFFRKWRICAKRKRRKPVGGSSCFSRSYGLQTHVAFPVLYTLRTAEGVPRKQQSSHPSP